MVWSVGAGRDLPATEQAEWGTKEKWRRRWEGIRCGKWGTKEKWRRHFEVVVNGSVEDGRWRRPMLGWWRGGGGCGKDLTETGMVGWDREGRGGGGCVRAFVWLWVVGVDKAITIVPKFNAGGLVCYRRG